MDAGSAPERVGQAHLADQLPNFERHLGSAGSSSRLPPPEQAKACAMPANNGCRIDDHERIQNTRRDPIQADEDQAIEVAEDRALRRPSVQYVQLMAQSQVLCSKRCSRPEQPDEHPPDQIEQVPHGPIHRPIRSLTPSGRDLRQRQVADDSYDWRRCGDSHRASAAATPSDSTLPACFGIAHREPAILPTAFPSVRALHQITPCKTSKSKTGLMFEKNLQGALLCWPFEVSGIRSSGI
jgi:hypothetical protein